MTSSDYKANVNFLAAVEVINCLKGDTLCLPNQEDYIMTWLITRRWSFCFWSLEQEKVSLDPQRVDSIREMKNEGDFCGCNL